VEQIPNYGDRRNLGWCIYCGGPAETRDHVPSRILLDEPYPENLPVVSACRKCNLGFSLDEEYFACLLECVLAGGVEPEQLPRPKIGRLLVSKPELATRLANARQVERGRVVFGVEADRIKNVLVKLARGHAAFELNEPQLDDPVRVSYRPLEELSPKELEKFEAAPSTSLWPEVGSRALQRLLIGSKDVYGDWVEVQLSRYRYLTYQGPGAVVRIVVAEYLGCEVIWE
jgi:hypothetical protein